MIDRLSHTTEEKRTLLEELRMLLVLQKKAIQNKTIDELRKTELDIIAMKSDLVKCDTRFLADYQHFRSEVLGRGNFTEEERDQVNALQQLITQCMDLELEVESLEDENRTLREESPEIARKLYQRRMAGKVKQRYGKR